MKGTNRIMLNYDAVVEAIQEYLDKRLINPPVVKGIGASTCTSWHTSPVTDMQGHTQMPGELEVRAQEPIAFLKGEKT